MSEPWSLDTSSQSTEPRLSFASHARTENRCQRQLTHSSPQFEVQSKPQGHQNANVTFHHKGSFPYSRHKWIHTKSQQLPHIHLFKDAFLYEQLKFGEAENEIQGFRCPSNPPTTGRGRWQRIMLISKMMTKYRPFYIIQIIRFCSLYFSDAQEPYYMKNHKP